MGYPFISSPPNISCFKPVDKKYKGVQGKQVKQHFINRYLILNVELMIESDDPDFINVFDVDFFRFKDGVCPDKTSTGDSVKVSMMSSIAGVTDLPLIQLSFAVILHGGDSTPHIGFEGGVIPLDGCFDKVRYAYRFILEQVFEKMDAFFMLHAGVVDKNGMAFVLAGQPGIGKTMMTLELLKQGFSFCSDDYCPMQGMPRLSVQPSLPQGLTTPL